jgi:rod shape determining protein RodA
MIAHLKKLDWIVLGAVLFLGLISLLGLYFLAPGEQFFERQLIFWLLGLGLLLFLSFFNWERLRHYQGLWAGLYLVTLAALVAVLFWGVKIRGASSWFDLGFFNFQPSEFAKLTLILVLAKFFSWRHVELYRARHVLISFGYTALLILPVLFQPDLGTALVFFAIWLGMLMLSGMRLRHFIWVILGGLVIAVVAWTSLLAPYQKERILNFVQPEADPLGAGYARTQSLVAIGSGKLWGQGFWGAEHARLGYLPESHTDFIFASLAEATGFIGAGLLLAALAAISLRLIFLGWRGLDFGRSPANFGRLLAAGLGVLILVQFVVNVGMNLGILPVTGLSLPFVSYGGSGLLAFLIGVGLYQGIYASLK